MKTRMILTAAVLFVSLGFAQASSKERTLSFRDALGRTLSIPVAEELAEPTPFDTSAVFSSIRSSYVNQVFDLSGMTKPEEEEPLPFDLDEVLKTIR